MEDQVEVVTDPAEVAAAREAWRQSRLERLTKLLPTPSFIGTTEGWDLLKADPELAFESLVKIRDDPQQPPHERMPAILGLSKLGVAPSAEQVAEIATSPVHHEAMWHFLVYVDALFPPDTPTPDAIRRTIGAALAHPREDTKQMAEGVVARYRLDEFAPTLLAMAKRGRNLRALAQMLQTEQVLDFLITGMRGWPQREAVACAMGLADFASMSGDATLRQRAADACVEFFANMKEPAGGGEIAVIDVVATIQPEALAQEMLRSMIRVTRDDNVRNLAQRALDQIEQARHRDDPPDPNILAAFVRHGLITQAEAARGGADIPPHERDTDFLSGMLGAITRLGRHIMIERMAEQVPYRHDFKVHEIAGHTIVARHFKPEAVLETYRPPVEGEGQGEYGLQFVHAERLYRVLPEDRGLQLDLAAVIAAVNRALADSGVADRFVAWTWDSALVQYFFAPPDALRAVAAEFGFEMQETEEE
jgi:hypothetical protein